MRRESVRYALLKLKKGEIGGLDKVAEEDRREIDRLWLDTKHWIQRNVIEYVKD